MELVVGGVRLVSCLWCVGRSVVVFVARWLVFCLLLELLSLWRFFLFLLVVPVVVLGVVCFVLRVVLAFERIGVCCLCLVLGCGVRRLRVSGNFLLVFAGLLAVGVVLLLPCLFGVQVIMCVLI